MILCRNLSGHMTHYSLRIFTTRDLHNLTLTNWMLVIWFLVDKKNIDICVSKKINIVWYFQVNFIQIIYNDVGDGSMRVPKWFFLNQALRFRGFCSSGCQLHNWALWKPSFEPKSFNSQKSENFQWEKWAKFSFLYFRHQCRELKSE